MGQALSPAIMIAPAKECASKEHAIAWKESAQAIAQFPVPRISSRINKGSAKVLDINT
jgi:hypothetical protein